MASATIYQAAKRHNSTSVPTGAGTVIDVQLKGGCDLNAPVFLLNYDDSLGLPLMSEISFGGRYYFVDSIRSIRDNLYEVSCSVDVLATYKTEIQATSAYVLYYSHNNTELTDKRLGVKTTKSIQTSEGVFDLLGNGTVSNSVVILGTTGKDSTCLYAISQATAKEITSNVDDWWENDIQMGQRPTVSSFATAVDCLAWMCAYGWEALKQLFATGKVSDSIRSAMMLPLPVSAIGGYTEYIQLGNYNSDLQGTRIHDRIFSDGTSVTIPWQATDWRRNAPYHEIYLYIPYVGLINLSPSDLVGYSSLSISVSLDLASGDAIFLVAAGSHVIGQYSANLGASYPIGSSNVTPIQTGTSLLTGAAGIAGAIATGGASAIISGTAGAFGLLNVLNGNPSTIGGNYGGAALGLVSKAVCITVFHDTIEAPSAISAVAGTPFMGSMSLSGVSGYVQTLAASVSGNMTDWERNEINRLLDGGVYIE